jgi:antitoxin component YwqK of YwqJK toxin-antitoxin module/peroxiredoxin
MTAKRSSVTEWVLFCALVVSSAACATPVRFVDTPQKRGELAEGLQTGPWTYFYPGGQTMATGDYVQDRQTGLWTYYHAGGGLEWQGIFKDLALDGPSSTWYPNGTNRTHGYFRAGDESGPWSFWNNEDQLTQTGAFLNGKRTMRWAQYHPDGSVKTEGHFFNDRSMGTWSFWNESGDLATKTFPMPPGVELFEEHWPDGNLRREGFLLKGKPHGIWLTWHADGTQRMQGEFQRGVPTGRWQGWEVDGAPLAIGEFESGILAENWTLWIDQRQTEVATASFVDAPEATEWSEDGMSAWFPATEVIPIWIGEMRMPAKAEPLAAVEAPEPSAGQLLAAGRRPRIPIRQQPWTVDEEQNIETLVSLYSRKTTRRRGGGRYGSLSKGNRRGDVASAEKRIGRPLPVTELLRGDDEKLDLKQFRGEREVLLVILRGYAGYVCAYCAAQTKALRDHFEEFEALNTEVVIVYPGNRDRLEAFLKSYESLVDEEGELPFTVAYDQDFEMVDSLELRSDLALPTTLLIDKDGVVRYAYIGTDKTDRPTAESLIAAIKRLR